MTAAPSTHQPGLPLELDSFVGRRRELEEIRRRLGTDRLVTLTGPGGVGKTRLALRAATELARTLPDGVWLAELCQVNSADALEGYLLRSMGALTISDAPSADQLVDYLADRQLLLVLDNCEHLVDAVAQVAHLLLKSCPGLRLLATSREPLGVPGEQALEVSPLALPGGLSAGKGALVDAVSLFVDRAADAAPGFAFTEDTRGAVERIVTQLDGLPLAIELAAARLRAMSAAELAERLTDRYRLLAHGNRVAASRHRTLLSCMEWSYQQCGERERLLWARLSVLYGGFEVDAVEGIAAFGELAVEDVFELLGSLVAKSIVTRVESPGRARFKLLETMRQFGRERLVERGELDETVARHRDWHVALVADAFAATIGPDQGTWWSRLDRERTNVRAATEAALARAEPSASGPPHAAHSLGELVFGLCPYWNSRGLFTEARKWIDHALRVTAGSPSPQRVRLSMEGAKFATMQGSHAEASRLLELGAGEADELGDPVCLASVSQARGFIALMSGDFPTAYSSLAQGVDLSRAGGDQAGLAMGLDTLVAAAARQGRLDEAQAGYDEGMALLEPQGECFHRGFLHLHLGHALMSAGKIEEARTVVLRGMRLHASIGARLGFGYGMHTLALCEGLLGGDERATVLGAAADRMYGDLVLPIELDAIQAAHRNRHGSARATLGERRYEAAHQRGWAMAAEEVVAYAVGEIVPDSPSGTSAPRVLTARELDVVELVADGLSNKEIAQRLVITPRTVRGHLENVMTKLGVDTRAQIASWRAGQSD